MSDENTVVVAGNVKLQHPAMKGQETALALELIKSSCIGRGHAALLYATEKLPQIVQNIRQAIEQQEQAN